MPGPAGLRRSPRYIIVLFPMPTALAVFALLLQTAAA